VRVESYTVVFVGGLPVQFFGNFCLLYDVSFSHNAQRHGQTDRHYDASNACTYDRLKSFVTQNQCIERPCLYLSFNDSI